MSGLGDHGGAAEPEGPPAPAPAGAARPPGAPLRWVSGQPAAAPPPGGGRHPLAPAPSRRGPGRAAWRRAGAALALVVLGAVAATVAWGARWAHVPGRPGPAARQVLTRIASRDLSEVVTVVATGRADEELGTAWPVDGRGDFVTNDHVVRSGLAVHVVGPGQREFPAVVTHIDARRDLALLHVTGLHEAPFPLAHRAARLGQPVVVLASEGATARPPVTEARITGLDEAATVLEHRRNRDYSGLIRIPSRIYPGNSGGPVLSERGRVVGVLTLAARAGRGAFAIPVAVLRRDIGRWTDWGPVRRG